jgi:N-acetylglutamate synthase-like GNAT family acetyltransferase
MTAITSRPVTADEWEIVIAFLRSQGYAHSVGNHDRFFLSEISGEIVGAVRLSPEEHVLVLRGMRIRPDVQRRGVGTHLLRRVALAAGLEACYCISYRWLIPFYAQVGFREVTVKQVPEFLAIRNARYVNDGLDVVMMYRPPG